MQDSSTVDFWDQRYRNGVTPWEGARWPQVAQRFFTQLPPGRLLMPGCGGASDLPTLAALGQQVLAVDFSAEAIAAARLQQPGLAEQLLQADFFSLALPPFACVLERAFLCALPPSLRSQYARQLAVLTEPGGVLAGFFFLADTPKGPPFGIAQTALEALLAEYFTLEQCEWLSDSLPVFRQQEYWMVWRRRSN